MQRLYFALIILVCGCSEDTSDVYQNETNIPLEITEEANIDAIPSSSSFCNCTDGEINEYPISINESNMMLVDSLVDNNKITHGYFYQLKDSILSKSITNQISKRGNWYCVENSFSPFDNEINTTDSTLTIYLKDTIQYKFNLSDGELHHTVQYIGYCEILNAYMLSNKYWDGTDMFWIDRATGEKFSLGSHPAINVESKIIIETFADEYFSTNKINIWDFNSYKEGPIKSLELANLSTSMFTTPPVWINSNQYIVKYYRLEKENSQSIRTYGIIELK